jgi:hypothetical protein
MANLFDRIRIKPSGKKIMIVEILMFILIVLFFVIFLFILIK